jgi:hypothetical protein
MIFRQNKNFCSKVEWLDCSKREKKNNGAKLKTLTNCHGAKEATEHLRRPNLIKEIYVHSR